MESRKPSQIAGYFPDEGDPQQPVDAAVVIPTILRPQLVRALESIYRQDVAGRVQILIGVDKPITGLPIVRDVLYNRPPNCSVILFHLPYSTSIRHGGVHDALDGGALRTMLSYMANSRYVAYMDDDNTWRPEHLRLLLGAIVGKAWAHAPRRLIEDETGRDLGVDVWDSVGPNAGRLAAFGGFVDPNCLMVDKLALADDLWRWSSGEPNRHITDRLFFKGIADKPHGRVATPTVNYYVRPGNILRRLAAEQAAEVSGVPADLA